MKISEEWRDIPGYEGIYQVSNLGNVRSLDRTLECKNGRIIKLKGKLLKQGNKNGYRFVNLCYGHSVSVHVLVAQAFLGDRPDKMDVCHINGNREFLKRGHNAFSCDIQEPSGGRTDRHIHGDVLKVLHGGSSALWTA